MKRFATLLVVIVITAFLMWGTTALLGPATDSEVFGIRVVGAGSFSWLTVGAGTGVLVVGVGGVGVVSIGLMGGAGILFGCGQVAAGSLVIGQLAVGVVATLAQVGVGLTGMGQLLGGFLVEGQVGLGFKDGDFSRRYMPSSGRRSDSRTTRGQVFPWGLWTGFTNG